MGIILFSASGTAQQLFTACHVTTQDLPWASNARLGGDKHEAEVGLAAAAQLGGQGLLQVHGEAGGGG